MQDTDISRLFSLKPKEIVAELDKHIIGQGEAKKAVAIALRNRWRRKQLADNLRDEVIPKNILMIGPTGVGKTEVGRRTAKLAGAPFIKVEATKFTEVGYVGKDVDSIVRDLVDIAINMAKQRKRKEVEVKAKVNAEELILDALVGSSSSDETRDKFRELLHENKLGDKEIEISVQDSGGMPMLDIPGMPGSSMGVINVSDMLGKAMGLGKSKTKKMTVDEAYKVLTAEESDKLIDEDKVVREAINNVENDGIVFLDEVDKIVARSDLRGGDVSREGVQRDLLPLIEGTVVTTKYGPVSTDHILFIASGAFHLAKPSDLLPELQGRLPIRVELKALTKDDLQRILVEPEASLITQNIALMATEGLELEFKSDAIKMVAEIAFEINENVENIGARRLHTILERLLEETSFTADERKGKKVVVDKKFVSSTLKDINKQADLTKFIL